jgi:hypothetical protein
MAPAAPPNSLRGSRYLFGALCIIFLALPAYADLGACEFYPKLAHTLECSSENYLSSFAEHYCRKFDKNISAFSPQGQKTLSEIKLCLQMALVDQVGLTCDNVRSIALQSHIDCYRQLGVLQFA